MAGIPVYLGTSASGNQCNTRISCFAKINTLLTHTTALVDLDFGTIGNLRLTWGAGVGWFAEGSYRGVNLGLALVDVESDVSIDVWYWLSAGFCLSNGGIQLYGQATRISDGMTSGVKTGSGTPVVRPSTPDNPTASLGWGVPIASGYNPFPNAFSAGPPPTGDEMTELVVETSLTGEQRGPLDVPTVPIVAPSSPTTHGIVALYHCNEPLGSSSSGSSIHDATANHYDLIAGPNGYQIVPDSPF